MKAEFRQTKGYQGSTHDSSSGVMKKIYDLEKQTKLDLNESKDNSLLAVTEAPNNNLIKWASPLYQSFGSIQTQVEVGHHSASVWKSILFQLVYSCAVLQEAEIYFNNFTIDGNFYIKDLSSDPGKRNHWIYKVGKSTFYVPNFGYLLMVDSDYADIYEGSDHTMVNSTSDRLYKINGMNMYKKNNKSVNSKEDYAKKCLESFKKVVDPDTFNNELRKRKGQSPDSSIINLLTKIFNDEEIKIRDYLDKYFSDYLNNRVGTILTREEKDNLASFPDTSFEEGELVAYQERFGDYRWALFIEDVPGVFNRKKIRLSYNSNPIEVFPNSLWKYPEYEQIKQTIKDGVSFDSEYTLETYNLDYLQK